MTRHQHINICSHVSIRNINCQIKHTSSHANILLTIAVHTVASLLAGQIPVSIPVSWSGPHLQATQLAARNVLHNQSVLLFATGAEGG